MKKGLPAGAGSPSIFQRCPEAAPGDYIALLVVVSAVVHVV